MILYCYWLRLYNNDDSIDIGNIIRKEISLKAQGMLKNTTTVKATFSQQHYVNGACINKILWQNNVAMAVSLPHIMIGKILKMMIIVFKNWY